MFKSDVTQSYNHQDATIEILVMLAGAFLLGCLLCWLIRKLLETKQQSLATNLGAKNGGSNNHHDLNNQLTTPQTLTGAGNNNQKIPVATKRASSGASTSYSTPRIDDLTKISGINTDVATELKGKDIKSYIDLRDSKKTLIDTLESVVKGNSTAVKEAQTWPHQASLAAKGEWEKLKEYQDFMGRSKLAADKVKKHSGDTQSSTDDLKMIEGIGPKIEEILNKNNINTFKDLSITDRDTLKSHLDAAGDRFKMHEPQSWPHQAGMADRGEWEELKIYHEFMDGGRETPSASASSKIDNDKSPEAQSSSTKDDLKKIEGIGPKIEEVLNAKGITTFSQLHHTDRDTIKKYLDEAGSQFKMHEPESWPHQAGMAERGDWEDLGIYQEFMDGGRESPSASSSSSATHFKSNLANKNDDLKKIEGIGPKIQELLNKAGINTFEDLKNSNRETIKKLLDKAGPQYRMHEPETWSHQARMAFKGEWDKLEEYQEFLLGGRG